MGKDNVSKKLVAMLLLGIIAGFAASGLLGNPSFFATEPPTGHQAVASVVHLTDTTIGVSYAPVFVRSGESQPLSMIKLAFTGAVKYSVWEFRAIPSDASTAYAVMMIWGAGTVGEFFVEIGRLSTDAFTGTYPNGTIAWSQGGNDGFAYFTYTP